MQEGKKRPTFNKTKVSFLDWSQLLQELSSEIRHGSKDRSKIAEKGIRERRPKQLLDDLRNRRIYRNLKVQALDRSLARQTIQRMT
jgi:hypothetical protein